MEWQFEGAGDAGEASQSPASERVPSRQWRETLSKFVEDHKGAPLSVRVIEVDGRSQTLDAGANVELRLIGMGEELEGRGRLVRILAHKHPGAEITQIEFCGAVDLSRKDSLLCVKAADGVRMDVRVSGSVASK